MIKVDSLSTPWITEKRKKFRKDPTIMEGMIYALYLLERLKLTGLDFIFKGGTSLVLLMDQPKRFSVDIDVIVSPSIDKVKLEEYLSKIVGSSVFILM
jgi:predicted nucleotidyltransferase component of viral defense system